MQTIIVGLTSGLVIGVICVVYVFLRTSKFLSTGTAKPGGSGTLQGMPYSRFVTSSGLMLMTVVGSGSVLWGFIGAGIYHLIKDDAVFFALSAALAAAVSIGIWLSKTAFAADKVVLSIIILMGLGFLIPWLI